LGLVCVRNVVAVVGGKVVAEAVAVAAVAVAVVAKPRSYRMDRLRRLVTNTSISIQC
jgi:hypothetical protein